MSVSVTGGVQYNSDDLNCDPPFEMVHIATATTTVVKNSPGLLHSLVINKAVANGVITIYDNTSAAGEVVGIITFGASLLSNPPHIANYDYIFKTGLTIVTSAATDLTVTYK